MGQIASALDHAHAQGVIHRDIKPENILLHEGVPMLTDFGIALAVREAGGERLTETGLVVGTPQYMSPEQATGDRLLDARSDLYSLGAVAYEMLAGEPPVLGGSAQAIIAKLITERPTPLRVVRDRIPEGIAEAVERVLAKVPADRFASGAEFVRALNAPPAAFTQLAAPRPSGSRCGVLIVALGVIAGEWLAERRDSSLPSTPSVIAVLPATPSGSDSALSKLGRDLVLTLSANLTGAGEIRAVDPQTVLGQVGGAMATRSRSQDLALGRRLGAGGVVRGTLVRVGADVRWDVDLISSEDGKLLAQASTTAPGGFHPGLHGHRHPVAAAADLAARSDAFAESRRRRQDPIGPGAEGLSHRRGGHRRRSLGRCGDCIQRRDQDRLDLLARLLASLVRERLAGSGGRQQPRSMRRGCIARSCPTASGC